ncbi:MAG: ABC transporter substrate-binding protein [Rhodoferax sp.]|nr:ABC transporter substrate-binding protein [Rhodoferax sp.]
MKTLFLCVALLWTGNVWAGEIVIASVAPFTGPLAENGEGNYIGAKAYIDYVNTQGGVNGNKIHFVREDDQYKPAETLRLVEMIAKRDRPVAFINLLGSANVALLLKEKTFDKLAIPAIGVTPGADSLRKPGSPYIFHLQASDNVQLEALLDQQAAISVKRIAVVYQDIPFGKGGLKFLEENVGPKGLQIVGKVSMAAGQDDAKAAAKRMAETKAQCYLLVLTPNSASAFVRDAREAGDVTPIYTMSYTPPSSIVSKAGVANAAGAALAQVTPNPDSTATGLVREYQALLTKYAPPGTPRSSFSLAGFLAAKVTVEGLRRSGSTPTSAKLIDAINGIRDLDLGGYVIDFSSGSRVGSKYVNIGVVGRNGKLLY